MTQITGDESAFSYGFCTADGNSHVDEKGLTIRQEFASRAMQSILRYGFDNAMGKGMFESIAKDSVTAADALIKELNKQP